MRGHASITFRIGSTSGVWLRRSMPAPSLNATELRCLFFDSLKRYVSSLQPVLTPT